MCSFLTETQARNTDPFVPFTITFLLEMAVIVGSGWMVVFVHSSTRFWKIDQRFGGMEWDMSAKKDWKCQSGNSSAVSLSVNSRLCLVLMHLFITIRRSATLAIHFPFFISTLDPPSQDRHHRHHRHGKQHRDSRPNPTATKRTKLSPRPSSIRDENERVPLVVSL